MSVPFMDVVKYVRDFFGIYDEYREKSSKENNKISIVSQLLDRVRGRISTVYLCYKL